jgi:hypothetical protein
MAELKTRETSASVEAFLAAVEDEARRADCRTVAAIMGEVTGEAPRMWGPSIVGFGRYHYRYASGHEGDACLTGFSPRKKELTLYLMPGLDALAPLLARLGKHKAGKGCLYVKCLADIDLAVLRELVAACVAHLRTLYPA